MDEKASPPIWVGDGCPALTIFTDENKREMITIESITHRVHLGHESTVSIREVFAGAGLGVSVVLIINACSFLLI